MCAADRWGRGGEGGERLLGQGEAPEPQGSSEEAGEPSEGVRGLRAPLNGVVRTGRPGAPPGAGGALTAGDLRRVKTPPFSCYSFGLSIALKTENILKRVRNEVTEATPQ